MDAMMILGEYVFGLNTAAFQELNRNTEWRWPSQDVFGARPALQFTGWGEDTLNLPGVIFPEYWGGTEQVNQLRALADRGQPQTLVDGRGNVLGDFVITGVQERQSTFGPAGVALRQEFTLTLKRYHLDSGAVLSEQATDAALASAAATADAFAAPTLGKVEGLTGAVESAITTAGRAAAALQAIQAATGAVQAITGPIGLALTASRDLQAAGRDCLGAVKGLTSASSYTTAMSAVNGVLATAGRTTATATRASAMLSAAAAPAEAVLEVNRAAVAATSIHRTVTAALGAFK